MYGEKKKEEAATNGENVQIHGHIIIIIIIETDCSGVVCDVGPNAKLVLRCGNSFFARYARCTIEIRNIRVFL